MGSCAVRLLAAPPVVSRYGTEAVAHEMKLTPGCRSQIAWVRALRSTAETTMSPPAASWLYKKHLWRRGLKHEDVESTCSAKISGAGLDYGGSRLLLVDICTGTSKPVMQPAHGSSSIRSRSGGYTQSRSHHLRYGMPWIGEEYMAAWGRVSAARGCR